jgi:nucleoside-triphosphatase THEP1
MVKRTHKPLHSLWLKAAVVGSLWASVEIILGSFFHNLNLPFSGTILSFIGVYLLISFFQVWKESGLIWRAGLICALMKSISPSAIILGPMIGIFTEAILIEFFIFLLGKNLSGYMIGGAFAVFSTIIHKLVNLLITYGFDFISILEALYHFCIRQLHMDALRPRYLILTISCIYLMSGMVAAILGYRSGKKYFRNRTMHSDPENLTLTWDNKMLSPALKHDFSLYFLGLNIAAIVLCLVLLNYDYVVSSILLAAAYVGFCLYHYTSALRRLKKVSVWIQFFLITLIAAFLWTGISENDFLSSAGLVIGLKMNFRALLIIIGFSAISVELKNPLIKSILYRKGFESLYQALGLSFSALPAILSSFPKSGKKRRKWQWPNTGLLQKAEILLTLFEKEHQTRPDVVIITGDIQQGKTTYAKEVVEILRKKGKIIGGFLAVGIHKNGKRIGFDLYNIKSSSQVPLCRTTANPDWVKQGVYYFDPEGIKTGLEILDHVTAETSQLVVIDEIGPMELNDKGWGNSVAKLCWSDYPPHLWIVRRTLVDIICRKWNVGTIYIFDIGTDTSEAAASKLEELSQPV